MSRKFKFNKNKILPDYKFNSILVSKFINFLMKNGKKSLSQYIFYKSINIVFKKVNKFDISIFENIIEKVRPSLEVKNKKIGSTLYKIPTEININRKNALAIRWIIASSKNRTKKKSILTNLTDEFIDILNNKGESINKKNNMHKIAESNKAFIHYKI